MKQFYKILLRKIHFYKKIFSKKIKMQFFFLINRDAVLRLTDVVLKISLKIILIYIIVFF